jgi:hypothetical protein
MIVETSTGKTFEPANIDGQNKTVKGSAMETEREKDRDLFYPGGV